jgi:hypothetical protein
MVFVGRQISRFVTFACGASSELYQQKPTINKTGKRDYIISVRD